MIKIYKKKKVNKNPNKIKKKIFIKKISLKNKKILIKMLMKQQIETKNKPIAHCIKEEQCNDFDF